MQRNFALMLFTCFTFEALIAVSEVETVALAVSLSLLFSFISLVKESSRAVHHTQKALPCQSVPQGIVASKIMQPLLAFSETNRNLPIMGPTKAYSIPFYSILLCLPCLWSRPALQRWWCRGRAPRCWGWWRSTAGGRGTRRPRSSSRPCTRGSLSSPLRGWASGWKRAREQTVKPSTSLVKGSGNWTSKFRWFEV